MDLTNIVSISGMPDLYAVAGQMKNGLLLQGLTDKKKVPVYASHKVSALDDISIYTEEEDVPLKEVFASMAKKEGGKASALTNKSSKDELVAYMSEILPDYDQDRVYISDIKKLVKWYNILASAGMAVEPEKPKAKKAKKEATEEAPAEEAPKAKAKAKKTTKKAAKTAK